MKAIIALALVAGCGAPKPDPATGAGAGAGAAADTGPVTPEMLAQRPVCDLVLCTLAEHQGACCYRLEHPTWAAFDDKMKTVADQANRCAAVSQYDGYFPVAVTYDASGAVTAVDKPVGFQGTLDPPTLACVSAIIRGVRLPASTMGDKLTYLFTLHPSSP
jgi:hypothetical protein